MADQLPFQGSASLHEPASIDRLVRHPQLRVLRMFGFQPTRDLLWSPYSFSLEALPLILKMASLFAAVLTLPQARGTEYQSLVQLYRSSTAAGQE